ncbi:heterogeneous nuclear ribonucleoprotein A1 [Elysia marginata]|uniref:Heterogeneous nuclear ribonucleoprotein A1 n=1 Tax=Elysia marginata TaxID=1093978 RepID=A0AAV4JAJ2_9GAST|nr:heterogeneous nuclear ribonucleoprotein A1 [Elysia marginata]
MPGYQNKGYPPFPYKSGPRYGSGDGDPDPNSDQFRKLFIGGLSFESSEAGLRSYFEKWGDISDCVVMRDPQSKRSRGFGFITFKETDSVDEVQANRPHKVDDREVETKRAMPRDDPNINNQLTVEKMFVGGLKEDTTEEMIRNTFSEFGEIKNIELITDKNTGKTKGFCFVTFDDYDPVDKLVLKRRILLNTRKVELKKAFARGEMDPRGRMAAMNMNMNMGMPMGRGGRGDFFGGPGFGGGYGPGGGYGGPGYGYGGPGWQGYNDYNYGGNRNNFSGGNFGNSGGYSRR